MDKSFYMGEAQRAHVARHFSKADLAGSHFFASSMKSPEELLVFINSNPPVEVIAQSKTRFAFRFQSNDNRAIGTCGLALRSSLSDDQIKPQVRDGFTIDIGFVDELPETNQFCVIADETPEGFSVITAFPGGYARPFARKDQPANEYAINKQFWEQHVLLKATSTNP